MRKIITIAAIASLLLGGCTSIQVNNRNGFQPKNVKQVCIIDNPKVIINGFNDSIVRSFARYDIEASVYPSNSKPVLCEITMTYTALRSWDFVPYMTYAKFTLQKDRRIVSEVEFRLRGKGGLALNKWRSTDTKIDELVDELLGKKSKGSEVNSSDLSQEKPLMLSPAPRN
ncbi:Sbal_3080 family lipoprotein [Acinetobacter sp. ME22]|uniref:Sbal_3080 family lipoprotein n=1 Tax=Acinetobacter sp. ME22 TaxID=2904802 RepID=UPI001EDBAD3F|nr:Sbal_3080 family lipoprotein [Acinetobacter sp. ME22]MCG2572396.1 Sbal_3080 family lipoprotein [Acinetobacter sp. ME22]